MLGKLVAIAFCCIALVYVGSHPGVVRSAFDLVTAPLNSWMKDPDKPQWPKLLGPDRQPLRPGRPAEKSSARPPRAKAEERLGVRAVAVQSARGL